MPPKHFVRSTASLQKAIKGLSSLPSTFEKKPRKSASKLLSGLLPSPEVSPKKLRDVIIGSSENGEGGVRAATDIAKEISSIVSQEGSCDDAQLFPLLTPDTNKDEESEEMSSLSWLTNVLPTVSEHRRKELKKERKAKWVRKNTQEIRFNTLLTKCAGKFGAESTFKILTKLGRETGIKECNFLIQIYLNEARKCNDLQDILVQIDKVYSIFKFMREKGFQIDEPSYKPLVMFLIDMEMTQEFCSFSDFMKKEIPRSWSRLGYYQMLLFIKVGNEAKIQELCNHIEVDNDEEDAYQLAENYLMAFCDGDRKKELLQFLEVLDVTQVSSLERVSCIFKSLGRLSLDGFARKFLLSLKTKGMLEEHISSVIFDYVSSIPDLEVEEVVSEFNSLHSEYELKLCNATYDKLTLFCCRSSKVHVAVDIVNQAHNNGWAPSMETFHLLLRMVENCGEFDLVHQIYLLMRQHNVVPTDDAVKSMINAYTRMKDFENAYNLLKDMGKYNSKATTGMYNALIVGNFREQNRHGVVKVLAEMEEQNIERDAETYSYLIGNCNCKEDIAKYYDEMKQSGMQPNKPVLMALINAFANCGMFDEAKQVLLDQDIPVKHLNDIRSALVSALASNGMVADALEVYAEIKRTGCHFQQKAVCTLIENNRSEGELDRLLDLLGDLEDVKFWFDGSSRVFLYCIRYSLLEPAVELLKQMKERNKTSISFVIDQAFCQLWENEVPNVEMGLKLLQYVKADLHLQPSRTSLDFLLSTCVKAKDGHSAHIIWSEYQTCNIQYNVLTFLRMYQALRVSGELHDSEKLCKHIPKDDQHVCLILNAC